MPETKNQGFQVVTLGAVKADGTPDIANILFSFPVPHQQMSVKQEVKIDEVDIPGRSGKVKQAVGYDDTEVGLTLILVDREERSGAVVQSAVAQLGELQAAFRDRSDPVGETGTTPKAVPRGVPTIFSIQSRLTDACGIKTVLFKGLEVNELSGDTALEVSITFIEFEPVARQIERRAKEQIQKQAALQEAKKAIGYDSAASGAHDGETGKESPLAAAFRQGKADAMGGMPE